MNTENTELIVCTSHNIRTMANNLRRFGFDYKIERVHYKNYNTSWKGYLGIGLRISSEDYQKLFKQSKITQETS